MLRKDKLLLIKERERGMKKSYIIAGIIAVAFLIGGALGPVFNWNEQVLAAEANDSSSISVSGQYSMDISPDIAYVTMSVETKEKEAKDAQSKNAHNMQNVYKKLKEIGIADKDIKTTNYRIYPNYDWTEAKGQVLTGYTVSNQINIKTKDLKKVSSILDSTVIEGINKVSSVSFGLSDEVRTKEYNNALKEAVKSAQSKAEAIASVHGIKLDKPFQIVEGGGDSSYNYRVYADMNMAESKQMAPTPINPGDVKVSASVQVVYRYK